MITSLFMFNMDIHGKPRAVITFFRHEGIKQVEFVKNRDRPLSHYISAYRLSVVRYIQIIIDKEHSLDMP